ncbi:MAG: hypothetical protein HeimC3_04540 [Candidatus Heimdallarchaeota archaeon LC_3]|nr:MAG: hypothetical protein HeimC3_04540 [Candidatus Heimdallarchaeota archaeon LC_3]
MINITIIGIIGWLHLTSYVITIAILFITLYITYDTRNSLDNFIRNLINIQKLLGYYVLMLLITSGFGFFYSLGISNWDPLGPVLLINDSGFVIKILSTVVLFTFVGTLHRILRIQITELSNDGKKPDNEKIDILQSIFRLTLYSILIVFFILFSMRFL